MSLTTEQAINVCKEMTLMMTGNVSNINSKKIIDYMTKNGVPPDIYLPLTPEEGGGWCPLLYFCCRNVAFFDLFKYLVSIGVDVNNTPRETTNSIELLYYCQHQYIPSLVKLNCSIDPENFQKYGKIMLVNGMMTKIALLMKWNAIKQQQVIQLLQSNNKLLFEVTEEFYRKMTINCQGLLTLRISSEIWKSNNDKLMTNYLEVYKFLLTNIPVNIVDEHGCSFFQRVLNTYFIPLIQLVIEFNPEFDQCKVVHYSNFDLSTRQVMCSFYNDDNFKAICKMVDRYNLPKKLKQLRTSSRTK